MSNGLPAAARDDYSASKLSWHTGVKGSQLQRVLYLTMQTSSDSELCKIKRLNIGYFIWDCGKHCLCTQTLNDRKQWARCWFAMYLPQEIAPHVRRWALQALSHLVFRLRPMICAPHSPAMKTKGVFRLGTRQAAAWEVARCQVHARATSFAQPALQLCLASLWD